jgi:peptide/nickel transport system permease protein
MVIFNVVVGAAIILACSFVIVATAGPKSVASPRLESLLAREILPRLPVTLELLIGSMIVSLAFGLTVAWVASRTRNRFINRSIAALALVLQSVPFFWLALSLSVLAAIRFGHSVFGSASSNRFSLTDHIAHLILPACIAALAQIPIVVCALKSSAKQNHGFEFMSRLYLAMLALAERLPEVIGACLITELAFAWPGEGRFLFNAVNTFDQPGLAMGVVALFGWLTLFFRAILRLAAARTSGSEVRDA